MKGGLVRPFCGTRFRGQFQDVHLIRLNYPNKERIFVNRHEAIMHQNPGLSMRNGSPGHYTVPSMQLGGGWGVEPPSRRADLEPSLINNRHAQCPRSMKRTHV